MNASLDELRRELALLAQQALIIMGDIHNIEITLSKAQDRARELYEKLDEALDKNGG